MLVVDDALLPLVLAGEAGPQTTGALSAGEAFTTGSWYWRRALATAIRLDATIAATTESDLLVEASSALGIPLRYDLT